MVEFKVGVLLMFIGASIVTTNISKIQTLHLINSMSIKPISETDLKEIVFNAAGREYLIGFIVFLVGLFLMIGG